MIRGREDLNLARRIVVKAGTSVVSTPEGYPSLSRLAGIVEQVSTLVQQGKEVLLVTSGAVGIGRQRLRKQTVLSTSMRSMVAGVVPEGSGKRGYDSACAAAGQLGLMSLYETLFAQYDITTSQLLVTSYDFESPERRSNLQGYTPVSIFSDNDSLASLVSREVSAQLLVLLTDVQGLYDRPPSQPHARIVHTYNRDAVYGLGGKSAQGRGGMSAKIDAALSAIEDRVPAVVIAGGGVPGVVSKVVAGELIGTLFLAYTGPQPAEGDGEFDFKAEARQLAMAAREGARALQRISSEGRRDILLAMAQTLQDREEEILKANAMDLEEARRTNLAAPLLKRLALTHEKLQTLSRGIVAIAEMEEPIGQVLSRTELSEGLILTNKTAPIGVLLIIFESRPDSLPQIAALSVRSGNGLLLKGGKEADHSNRCLHALLSQAMVRASEGRVPAETVSLITSRAEVSALLELDDVIDLCIPRGSSELVSFIKDHTKIPVMGHSEGICHVYVDGTATAEKAVAVCVDSKTDYPAACNACETILFHQACVDNSVVDAVLRALRSSGVSVRGGPRAQEDGLVSPEHAAQSFHVEYGNNTVCIELVSDVEAAIRHINTYGSGHTDAIVTEDAAVAEAFLSGVDSACVFHNASTRFADGYRFGLGAEVGISTGRIHARGPVGVQGLLTHKYTLCSASAHTVAQFNSTLANPLAYTHKKLV